MRNFKREKEIKKKNEEIYEQKIEEIEVLWGWKWLWNGRLFLV